MIVYLARDIPAFVMYCVYGESRSYLLIESTDSMILYKISAFNSIAIIVPCLVICKFFTMYSGLSLWVCLNFENVAFSIHGSYSLYGLSHFC